MTAFPETREDIGESPGAKNHDHDLIHELSKRFAALWRYDQRIANAEGHHDLQSFWQVLKSQEPANVKCLKQLIAKEIEQDFF